VILSQLTGSLWDPNITACKKNETMVEVNFTTSPPGNRYMALIQNTTVIGTYVTGSRHEGFSSCGLRTLEHRLSSCGTRA
uniref:Uncharacterized protein n=1 Tax=Monodon monoceros TaxID=40151 RepID=A0A8C6BTE6_MONMO